MFIIHTVMARNIAIAMMVDMDSERYYSYADHDSFKTMKREVKNLTPR